MNWHEDFGDEPSIEERLPHGLSLAETKAELNEASLVACDECGNRFHSDYVVTTGDYEFYTMDVDLDSTVCLDCYDASRDERIPDDLSLIDVYTPLQLV